MIIYNINWIVPSEDYSVKDHSMKYDLYHKNLKKTKYDTSLSMIICLYCLFKFHEIPIISLVYGHYSLPIQLPIFV